MVFCLPWAFEDGMTWVQGWTDTYEDMQIEIYENTLEYSNNLDFVISPVGWAWYKVLKEKNYPLHYLHMSDWKAHRSLHGGIGLAAVFESQDEAEIAISEAKKDGRIAQIIGKTTTDNDGVIKIKSKFKEGKT